MNDFDKRYDQFLKSFDHQFETHAFQSKPSWERNKLPTDMNLVDNLNRQLAYEHEYQKQRTDALVKYMIKNMIEKKA